MTGKILIRKIQKLDITGQEILTADKVGVRLNVVCSYRITDPERLVKILDGAWPALHLRPAGAQGVCGPVPAG